MPDNDAIEFRAACSVLSLGCTRRILGSSSLDHVGAAFVWRPQSTLLLIMRSNKMVCEYLIFLVDNNLIVLNFTLFVSVNVYDTRNVLRVDNFFC